MAGDGGRRRSAISPAATASCGSPAARPPRGALRRPSPTLPRPCRSLPRDGIWLYLALAARLAAGKPGRRWPSGTAAVAALIAALTAPSGPPKKVTVDSDGSYGFDSPGGIAVDGGHVWVANERGDSVTELNAGDGSLVQTLSGDRYGFDYPAYPALIAVDGADVWIASRTGSSLTELNAGDGSLVRTVSGGSDGLYGPSGIAVDGTHLWVTNEGGGSISRRLDYGTERRKRQPGAGPVRRQLRLRQPGCHRRRRRPCLGRQLRWLLGNGTERGRRQPGAGPVRRQLRLQRCGCDRRGRRRCLGRQRLRRLGNGAERSRRQPSADPVPRPATAFITRMRSPWTAPMSGSPTGRALR